MKSDSRSIAAITPTVDYLNITANSLRRIVRAIRLSSTVAEETLGTSGAQLFVLQQLADHPASSVGELAGHTLTDQSSVSVVVGRLVRRRLVARRTSSTDKRKLELSLSPAGRALLRRAPELAQSRLLAALRLVDTKDLRTVARVLDQIASAMGAERGPAAMFFETEITKRKRPRGGQ